jgi:DNA N-6-adenine-methyltransferase (Dam)
MAGPTINRRSSEQVVETPDEFIDAVALKFGQPEWDLAALPTNAKARFYITPKTNSFTVNWSCLQSDGRISELGSKRLADIDNKPLLWLNPEFAHITPWARKCAEESDEWGARILMLVPGSIGANWYWDWVRDYADVYSVGRMVFKNCYNKKGELITTPYPKDLILCHFYKGGGKRRMERWYWK